MNILGHECDLNYSIKHFCAPSDFCTVRSTKSLTGLSVRTLAIAMPQLNLFVPPNNAKILAHDSAHPKATQQSALSFFKKHLCWCLLVQNVFTSSYFITELLFPNYPAKSNNQSIQALSFAFQIEITLVQ